MDLYKICAVGSLAILASASAFANMCGSPGTTVFTPITSDLSYSLILDEEFNGTTLNTAIWSPAAGVDHTYNNTSAYFTAANVSVHDGCLDLAVTQPSGGINGYTYATSGLGATYPNGGVSGPGVYWEAREKFSRSTVGSNTQASYGLAEDFWTDTGPSPTAPSYNYPEIDFSEWWGNQPNYSHGNWNPGAAGNNTWYGAYPNFGKDLTTDWHVWGTLWTSTAMTFYLDGVQFYTTSNNVNQSPYVWLTLLSMTVSGAAGGNPNSNTVLPAHFFVDYIHVYAKNRTAITPQANYGGPGDARGTTVCTGN